jgi:CRP/FNR family cyclic AMP-dependent transcriptional regulator
LAGNQQVADTAENTEFAASLTSLPGGAEERADLLEGCEWSKGFDRAQIETIAQYMGGYSMAEGEFLFREADTDAALGLVASGSVHILKEDAHHHERSLAEISSGRAFGEMSLIDGEPRSASAQAGEASTVLTIDKPNFIRLIDEHPRLGAKLIVKLARRISRALRQTNVRLVEFLDEDAG